MEIRQATIADYEQLKELKLKAKGCEKRHNKWSKPIIEVKNYYYRYLKSDLLSDRKVVFVAVCRGKIVGMVIGKVQKALPVMRYAQQGYITGLYVLPRHRRAGMAEKLVFELIGWFQKRKVEHLWLEVYNRNAIGLSLYRKLGFKEFVTTMVKKL